MPLLVRRSLDDLADVSELTTCMRRPACRPGRLGALDEWQAVALHAVESGRPGVKAAPRLADTPEPAHVDCLVIVDLRPRRPGQDAVAMDALDALDAIGKRNVELVAQVRPEQWDDPTPCTEWNVRTLAGHLIAGRYVYRGLLEGVPVAELRPMLQRQGEAVGDDPIAACEQAVQSIHEAFTEPGALERTVHHTIGDMPGSQLLVQLVADCAVHSWDLATAIGADPGLDEQLVQLAGEFYAAMTQLDAVYAYGWFKPPAQPLPEGATPLERLIHLVGR
jgi:uncharacterized protein (TIGR03086 family)